MAVNYYRQVRNTCPRCKAPTRDTANFCSKCGYKLTVFRDLKSGTQIGNYIVDRFLGSGGIGAVYLSHHRLLKQSAALKIHDYFSEDIYVGRVFLRASNYLSQLNHPNIVHLYDFDIQDGKAYQAIEYINGPTFAQLLPLQQTKSWIDRCIEYFGQLLAALDYAHRCPYIDVDGTLGRGIIHGDIKPHNIFLDHYTDTVKLSDFMIPDVQAFLEEQDPDFRNIEASTGALGTPDYMAPEQEEGQISPQTDIFSLGITMYHLVTGYNPIARRANRIFRLGTQQPKYYYIPPRDENPYVPAWLSDLIVKATQRDPAYRFRTIAEMIKVFQDHPNQERAYTFVNTDNVSTVNDQRVIGQFNNVVASLNTTSQMELAGTLKLFKEAIMASTSSQISSNKRQELIEIINQIGEEATRVVPNTTFLRIVSEGLLKTLRDIPDASLSAVAETSAPTLIKLHKEQEKMNKKIRVLFLAANPKDTPSLRLDEEIRGIDLALRQADFRDKFDISQQWAVRVADLQSHLLRHKPDIVHFSGHGSLSSEIILEDNSGNSHPVLPHALSQMFSILKDNIRCVVLNACYSEQQARAIAQNIDCVIGMSQAIGDVAAVSFAVAFYQALGYGRNVKTAFDLGCSQIDLENLNEQNTPKLLTITNPANMTFVDNDS